jgi:hypothetical protein
MTTPSIAWGCALGRSSRQSSPDDIKSAVTMILYNIFISATPDGSSRG